MKKLILLALFATAPALANVPVENVERWAISSSNELLATVEDMVVVIRTSCALPRRDFELGFTRIEEGAKFFVLSDRTRRKCTMTQLTEKPSS